MRIIIVAACLLALLIFYFSPYEFIWEDDDE